MVECQYCRTENRADATYCNSCGGLLKGHAPPASANPAPSPARAPTTNATGRLPLHTRLAGSYLIVKNIGQGGMAAVYQATDIRNGTMVAIKEMSQDGLTPDELKEAMASFRFEADTLMRLRHPNLPRVFGTFSEGVRHYLVMDFIDGQTLEQKQQAAGGVALPEAEVLGWAHQLCSVLGYLHMQRPPIIFRDLKPANIMVTSRGQIQLIDFGIARVFAPGRTRDTQVLGTPGFAPPEQYGKAQTDNRADIYALGCTLYQLLTGYDPATTPFNLPPMSSRNLRISPRVQRAIEKATQLTREARYATVEEFGRDLLGQPQAKPVPKVTFPHPAVHGYATATAGPSTTASAASAAAPPTAAVVVVQPHLVDFGQLVAGQRGTLAITISGLRNIPIRGQIKALSPWVRVDRDTFNGPSTVIQVSAETSRIQGTGRQKSSLQIICDGQQLFVPVSVTVAPAPQPAKATKGTKPAKAAAKSASSAPSAQPAAARPPATKHGVQGALTSRTARLLTGAALAFTLAMSWIAVAPWLLMLHMPPLPKNASAVLAKNVSAVLGLLQHVPLQPMTAPTALGMLLLAVVLASIGAVLGSGGRSRGERLRTAVFGALLALAALLALDGHWLLPTAGASLLRGPVHIPSSVVVLAPLVLSVGAALGADARNSRWMLATAAFLARHAQIVVTTAAIVLGGWVGYALTQGIACLTPLGVIAGIVLGLSLARPTNRLLRRSGRVRVYPSYRRFGP
jgi:serine/threonine protein kinase